MTYRSILNEIQNIKNNKKISQNLAILEASNLYETATVLELTMESDEDWGKDYSLEEKITIGLFILNFYFPPKPEEPDSNTQSESYITFDAGSPIPTSIFGLMNEVINLVTPLNVADSATSESHLIVKTNGKKGKRNGVKNYYYFPYHFRYNDTATNNVIQNYYYSSNIYTKSKPLQLSISLPQNEYVEGKQYDFFVKMNEVPSIFFNKQRKSGPSVKYLSTIIGNKIGFPESSMTDLSSIPKELQNSTSLLFDLKRTGDWEQCNAAKTSNSNEGQQRGRTILCTLDRLCALYSRCIGQNTMYHQATNLTLFRFEGVSAPIEQRLAFANKKIAYFNSNQAIIISISNNISVFKQAIEEKKQIINLLTSRLYNSPLLKQIIEKLFNKTVDGLSELTQLSRFGISNLENKISVPLLDNVNNNINLLNETNMKNIFSELAKIPDNLKIYLKKLSDIIGKPISTDNYADIIDKIILKINLLNEKTTKSSLVFKICYCNFKMIKELDECTTYIKNVKPTVRNLEKANFSNDIKFTSFIEIIRYIVELLCNDELEDNANIRIDNVTCKLLNELLLIQFDTPLVLPEGEFKLSDYHTNMANSNDKYLKEIRNIISKINTENDVELGNFFNQGGQGLNEPIQYGQSYEEVENLLNNLEATLINEFLILTNSITEIYEIPVLQQYDFDYVINGLKQTIISDKSKLEIENNIFTFLNVCTSEIITTQNMFDGSITQQMANKFNRLKEVFSEICYLFSYLSFDYNNANINENSIIQLDDFQLLNPTIINNFGFNEQMLKIIEPTISVNRIFNTRRTSSVNATLSPLGTDIYFMLKYSIKLQNKRKDPENLILVIFIFLQNYFKHVISKKNPEHGYYPGLIKEFNDGQINALFQKLELVITTNTSNNINSEFEANKQIFDNFGFISYHLLAYIYNPSEARQLTEEARKLTASPSARLTTPMITSGGKRTIKRNSKTYKNNFNQIKGKNRRVTKRQINKPQKYTRKSNK